MSTTIQELNAAAKEYNAALKAKEDALTRFQQAMYKWDKLVNYADPNVLAVYYDQLPKKEA